MSKRNFWPTYNGARGPRASDAITAEELDELSRFKNEASVDVDTAIYQWFFDNKLKFPKLYKIH